jgi:hypothetical protein
LVFVGVAHIGKITDAHQNKSLEGGYKKHQARDNLGKILLHSIVNP